MIWYGILMALHALAAVVWVGGMAFAYFALRPAAQGMSLAERLALWSRVFGRFFLWVWIAIAVLVTSGYWLVFGALGGMANLGLHVHLMQGLGWLMFLLFGHVFFGPWRRMRAAMAAESLEEAGRYLNQIRRLIAVNLALGLAVVAIAAGGRYGLLG